MAESYAYEGLKVAIREDSAAGLATLGVVVDGAFIPFQSVKLEGFREDLREGREQAQDEQAAQPQEQPPPQSPPTE